MAFTRHSPVNVHVALPDPGFAVDLARDKNMFLLNQIVPSYTVQNINGKYWKFDDPEAFRRVRATDVMWSPGGDSLPNTLGTRKDIATYECKRRALREALDTDMLQNADEALQLTTRTTETLVARLMLEKTINAFSTLTDGTSLNTATCTAAGGGKWSASTSSTTYIQKSIQGAVLAITQNSYGTVDPRNIKMVINPLAAQHLARNGEIRDIFKQSNVGAGFVASDAPWWAGQWHGIPNRLYGVEVVVASTYYNTSEEGKADSNTYPVDDDAIFVHVDSPGLRSYSTATFFEYEPMTVEMFGDGEHNREKRVAPIHVVTWWDFQITAKNSGYLLTDVYD